MLQPHRATQKVATFDSNAITFALLGVAFTLLIIQLVMAPPFDAHGPDIPAVAHPVAMYRADKDDALRVGVTKDGRFYMDNEFTDEVRMIQDLKVRLRKGAEPKLYIEADARARYASVSKVLDAASAAGIFQIGFLVEQRKVAPISDK
ncbi:MAG TPA: biopolymer transporter ExbD [Terriglobales bacterium]|jgi:biopolymer transport protein ExbD